MGVEVRVHRLVVLPGIARRGAGSVSDVSCTRIRKQAILTSLSLVSVLRMGLSSSQQGPQEMMAGLGFSINFHNLTTLGLRPI